MNQQAKKWINYWNSKFPSLLGTIRESKYMFYEQLGNKSNYRSLHNCLVRNLVKDILEPAEAKIFIFEGEFDETLGLISEVLSESFNALDPLPDTEGSEDESGYYTLHYITDENPRKRGRPPNPNSVRSILRSADGMAFILKECEMLRSKAKSRITKASLARALQREYFEGDASKMELASILKEMTPSYEGERINTLIQLSITAYSQTK
jgi:hypothetical protein